MLFFENQLIRYISSSFLLYLFTAHSVAGELFDSFPETINPDEKYVFYSHGFGGVTSTVKQALSDPAYNLIVYERTPNTDQFRFAVYLAAQITELISRGVKPENITLLGFSDGGVISILASYELKNDNINVIIMAGCAGIVKVITDIVVYGHIYSIYDIEDKLAGSCQFLIDRKKHNKTFIERTINTGDGHIAFRTPLEAWIVPVKQWIKNNSN